MIRHQRQNYDWGINAEGSSLEGGAAQVAMNGDTVFIHYICRDEDGNMVDDSAESEDHPVSFEVGAGEITGNPLFQAFDEAIRGLPLGSTTVLEARGGDWNRELFFEVPRDHAEIQRLEGRYKNQGGLQDGLIVELSNGGSAMVVAVTDDVVKIDANNMLAGKRRIFEVTLLNIEPAQR
ncbi:FKBP-like protein [Coccomyxa subellipsoidea C-169]|uniref:peptidylprolyl isomerase n=1 Tax=Coccomyxa subellipsoidea (strain C-169) TaxID=574566 RepID=I0YYY8_COCSC|nr:FKBP-like protein [Coccomyxa subellipsoidea C-169]EIE23607.1 FKBP-like protein [Coccomyxa subellipsoidea C-169]|eukprot:XP_005648151.1 FKBP-like protein [Coccomyxa subellipsoidea C-169]